MKKIKKIVAMFSVLVMMMSIGITTPTYAAGLKDSGAKTTKTYTVQKVDFQKHEYSKWKRLNSVFTARRKGETAHYNETKTVKTTSSLNISVPIKQISAKLGYQVENLKSSTIRGTNSAPLKAKESAAFYYRDHWKVYKVTYKVTEKTTSSKKGGGINVKTRTYTETKTIKVAQKLDSSDYGWFYANKASSLPKNLDGKYCDDNYTCKVK